MPPPADAAPRGSTRATPTVLLAVAVVLLLARVVLGIVEKRNPPEAAERVQWRPFEAAVAEARSSGRPLLYDFTADWCPPCRLMKKELFSDKEAAERINTAFVPVRVLDRAREDGHNTPVVDSLQHAFGITGFPMLVVVSADGVGEPIILDGYGEGSKAREMDGLMRAAVQMHSRGANPFRFQGNFKFGNDSLGHR